MLNSLGHYLLQSSPREKRKNDLKKKTAWFGSWLNRKEHKKIPPRKTSRETCFQGPECSERWGQPVVYNAHIPETPGSRKAVRMGAAAWVQGPTYTGFSSWTDYGGERKLLLLECFMGSKIHGKQGFWIWWNGSKNNTCSKGKNKGCVPRETDRCVGIRKVAYRQSGETQPQLKPARAANQLCRLGWVSEPTYPAISIFIKQGW